MFGVETDSSVGVRGKSSGGFKRNIPFLMELAFDDQLVVLALDAQLLDGSVRGGKDILVQDLSQGLATDRNFGRGQDEGEGVFVVEDNDVAGVGWRELALQANDMDGDGLTEVIHDILHRNLHSVRIRRIAGLSMHIVRQKIENRREEEDRSNSERSQDRGGHHEN